MQEKDLEEDQMVTTDLMMGMIVQGMVMRVTEMHGTVIPGDTTVTETEDIIDFKLLQPIMAIMVIMLRIHILIFMSLNVVGFNVNGFTSSEPYIIKLCNSFDIVCLSEHWLSGPELYRLKLPKVNVVGKCSDELKDSPPDKGRGFGGVAIMWREGLIGSEIRGIQSDRVVAVRFKCEDKDLIIISIYMPCYRAGNDLLIKYMDVLRSIEEIIGEYQEFCEIIIIGDYNANLGKGLVV